MSSARELYNSSWSFGFVVWLHYQERGQNEKKIHVWVGQVSTHKNKTERKQLRERCKRVYVQKTYTIHHTRSVKNEDGNIACLEYMNIFSVCLYCLLLKFTEMMCLYFVDQLVVVVVLIIMIKYISSLFLDWSFHYVQNKNSLLLSWFFFYRISLLFRMMSCYMYFLFLNRIFFLCIYFAMWNVKWIKILYILYLFVWALSTFMSPPFLLVLHLAAAVVVVGSTGLAGAIFRIGFPNQYCYFECTAKTKTADNINKQ